MDVHWDLRDAGKDSADYVLNLHGIGNFQYLLAQVVAKLIHHEVWEEGSHALNEGMSESGLRVFI